MSITYTPSKKVVCPATIQVGNKDSDQQYCVEIVQSYSDDDEDEEELGVVLVTRENIPALIEALKKVQDEHP